MEASWTLVDRGSGSLSRSTKKAVLGTDFGVRPRIMLVGDFDYQNAFRGHLEALGFAIAPDDARLLFVFDSEESALTARSSIDAWFPDVSDPSNGFRAWIVLKDDGTEYTLLIHRDSEHIERSILGAKPIPRLIDAVLAITCYGKPFDVSGEHVALFRDAVASGLEPTADFVARGGKAVASDIPILVRVLSESELEAELDSPAANPNLPLVKATIDGPIENQPPVPPDDEELTPAEIGARRASVMESWFPHTLAICRSGAVPVISGVLDSRRFANWQILQAACYLSAADAMGSRPTAGELAAFLHHNTEGGNANLERVGRLLDSLEERTIAEQIRKNNLYLAEHLSLPIGRRRGGRYLQSAVKRWSES